MLLHQKPGTNSNATVKTELVKHDKSRPKKSQTRADRLCGAHVNKSVVKVEKSYNFYY